VVTQSGPRKRTEAALARLDASGADPGLVALCNRCLAFEPADRPASVQHKNCQEPNPAKDKQNQPEHNCHNQQSCRFGFVQHTVSKRPCFCRLLNEAETASPAEAPPFYGLVMT
jgi:hypothetical protein